MQNETPQPETLTEKAEHTVKTKANIYGDPVQNMTEIAKRWSITLCRTVTVEEVVRCLIDLKQSRLSNNPNHTDSILDIIGYSIILDMVGKYNEQTHQQQTKTFEVDRQRGLQQATGNPLGGLGGSGGFRVGSEIK